MRVGDPPAVECRETCQKCGNPYRAVWHYGKCDGHSEGYAERLCCKSKG